MSLIKAIKHNKEKRKPSKYVCSSCENHGGRYHTKQCEWCLGNRTHSSKIRKEKWS